MKASGEVTLREVLLIIRDYVSYLWTKKWWIIAAGLVGAALYTFVNYRKAATYTANLTFMVNEDEQGGGTSPLARLAGGFLGDAAGGGNLDRIKALSSSDKILTEVLFDSLAVDGQQDYFANHLIRIYDFHEQWRDNEQEQFYDFTFADKPALFDTHVVENLVLKMCLSRMRGSQDTEGLVSMRLDEDTDIMTISIKSLSPELSLHASKRLFHHLESYYVTRTIEPQIKSYNILKIKADSIEAALAATARRLASLRDRSVGIETNIPRVGEFQLQQEQAKLSTMLAAVVQNLETSDFLLKNAPPYFQAIDVPYAPLYAERPSLPLSAVIGFILGAVVLTTAFMLFKITQDALNSDIT